MSSRMDFVFMEVITAQIEQVSEENQRASAIQRGSGILVHVIVARVAPAQKDAWGWLVMWWRKC